MGAMTPDEMRASYEAHLAAVNDHDIDRVLATFHPDCFIEDLAFGLRVEGLADVERYFENLFTTFRDAKMFVESWAFGDDVAVAWGSYQVSVPPMLAGVRHAGPIEITSGVTIAHFTDRMISGERIFLNLGSICDDAGVSIDQVRRMVRMLMV